MGLVLVIGGGTAWAAPSDHQVSERVKSAVKIYVANRLFKDPVEIDVKDLSPTFSNEDISLEDDLAVRRVAEEVDQKGLLGRASFLLSIKKRDGTEYRQWIAATVSLIRKVLVANRLIQRMEPLISDAFSVQKVYQTRLEQEYIETPSALLGQRADHTILPGEPLTVSLMEEAPVIRRGDQVTLVVEGNGLRITTLGRAKKDGFLGQKLDVVVLNSNKVIHGTVISASEVQVPF